MGILTDPNSASRSKLANLVTAHHAALSWLCFLAGIVFLFVLPHPIYNEKTYFSENALLPGLVTGQFDQAGAAEQYLAGLQEEGRKYPDQMPLPWLEAQFRQLGLEVYQQQFSLAYPLGNSTFSGTNLYAILRAPKASSTEALVLSAPHRPRNNPHPSTQAGIALLLASAKYFRSQIYWAKDLIFLITEHEFLGTQAWLEGYHGVSYGQPGVLKAGDLPARAGSIQAAINLELGSQFPTHLNVKIAGLNGQLPNLDLVNLVNRLVVREGLRQMFQSAEDHSKPDSYKGYTRALRTMASMMSAQAGGVPTGNHGLYHRFSIEAVTLEGVTVRSRKRTPADFHTLGRVVEGTFRSLNNLLERFHQSFFFYLLASGSRYISIGLYMPMFGLLAGGFCLTAVGLWFSLVQPGTGEAARVPVVAPPHLGRALPLCLASHCLGLLAWALPPLATRAGGLLGLTAEESLPLAVAAYTVLLLLLPVLPRPKVAVPHQAAATVRCLASLELAALLGATGLYNISLATMLTLPLLPLVLVSGLNSTRLGRAGAAVYGAACHPACLALLAATVHYTLSFPDAGAAAILAGGLRAWQSGVVFSVVDRYIYGSLLYSLLTVWVLPPWLLLYLAIFSPSDTPSAPPADTLIPAEKKDQ